MNRFRPAKWILASAVGALLLPLAGCGDSPPENGSATLKPTNHADEIKRLQDNPNMPESAKQSAIAALQRGTDSGKAIDDAHPPKK